jgi:hypothetical protein
MVDLFVLLKLGIKKVPIAWDFKVIQFKLSFKT